MFRNATFALLVAGSVLVPTATHAAIFISEVAWMGSSVSANAEWIELQNTETTPVDISGWTITSSSGSPAVTLTGSIAATGYYLLERTNDSSVPTVVADQIYNGALSNAGLTLTLSNPQAVPADVVVGGTNWQLLGGDNTSKQTAQRVGDAWVTADPTPKAPNGSGSVGGGAGTTTPPVAIPGAQPSVGGSPLISGSVVNPIPKLSLDIGIGRVVAAGARVPFQAQVYDSFGSIRHDARITWSFGDGSMLEGPGIYHSYEVPGTYLLIAHATAGASTASAAITVQADSTSVTIVRADVRGITLRNERSNILDLSDWKLVWGDSVFQFPGNTALFGSSEVTFPSSVTLLNPATSSVRLLFPDGKESTSFGGESQLFASKTVRMTTELMAQPQDSLDGIKEQGDSSLLPVHDITPTTYATTSRAPSAPVDTGALGASVVTALKAVVSPWTFSLMGLVVAVGAVLGVL